MATGESTVCLRTKLYYASVGCFTSYLTLQGAFAKKQVESSRYVIFAQVVQATVIALVINLPSFASSDQYRYEDFPLPAILAVFAIGVQFFYNLGCTVSEYPVPLWGPLAGLVVGTGFSWLQRTTSDSSLCPGPTRQQDNYMDVLSMLLVICTGSLLAAKLMLQITAARKQWGVKPNSLGEPKNLQHQVSQRLQSQLTGDVNKTDALYPLDSKEAEEVTQVSTTANDLFNNVDFGSEYGEDDTNMNDDY